MAYFNGGSRAVVEILSNLQNVEVSLPVDHIFHEFGSVRYHIQASAMDHENIYLSISTPSISQEESISNILPEKILQNIRKMYSKFAEIIQPPKEGYTLTLKLNFNNLTRPKGRKKAINAISSVHVVILNSQLKDLLRNIGTGDLIIQGSSFPIKMLNYQKEPFFIIRGAKKITGIFPMHFKDDSDVVLATSFFQELVDKGNTISKALNCTWSSIPPEEIRGEFLQNLSTNGGFFSFDIFKRHLKGKKAAKTAWMLLNFQAYVKYHIKCTKGFIQRKMRQHVEVLSEAIEKAKIGGEIKPIEQSKRHGKKWMGFTKSGKLKRGLNFITDQIKRLRLKIKIRGLSRLNRRLFNIPKLVLYSSAPFLKGCEARIQVVPTTGNSYIIPYKRSLIYSLAA